MIDVKIRRRPYQSQRRQAQATKTREAVLEAAKDLFLEQGWMKTTIAAVAKAAGVSPETVYSVFDNKRTLLQELITRAVRGADPDTPLIRQAMTRRIADEADQGRQIELFVVEIAGVLAHVAPLMDVLRSAASTDPTLAILYKEIHRGRRANLIWFARALLRNGPLRVGADAEAVGTILWRLASPDLYLLMRNVEGASEQTYIIWLKTTLQNLLLAQ